MNALLWTAVVLGGVAGTGFLGWAGVKLFNRFVDSIVAEHLAQAEVAQKQETIERMQEEKVTLEQIHKESPGDINTVIDQL